jgi:hypothetical protein
MSIAVFRAEGSLEMGTQNGVVLKTLLHSQHSQHKV